jgi:hypothetical protein
MVFMNPLTYFLFFLTPRIFSLEFISQRIISETEHFLKLIIKVPKISVYNKRSSSEAMGISDQQTAPKKMKVTQPT